MPFGPRLVTCAVVLACAMRPAVAEREIRIVTPGERSASNRALLAGLAGAGVLAGGLGLYWHLDSRSAANEVSANKFTGREWTPADAALVDRAEAARGRATVAYAVGGALVLGAIVALIVTEPAAEVTVIRPRRATATLAPTLAPTEGGALLGGLWSF